MAMPRQLAAQSSLTYHEHYVSDGCHPHCMHQLLNNLSCCQVPFQTHGACTATVTGARLFVVPAAGYCQAYQLSSCSCSHALVWALCNCSIAAKQASLAVAGTSCSAAVLLLLLLLLQRHPGNRSAHLWRRKYTPSDSQPAMRRTGCRACCPSLLPPAARCTALQNTQHSLSVLSCS